MTKHVFAPFILILSLLVSACGGGAFSSYSDADLRQEFRKCDFSKLSPAGAQRCNNIKKECDARRKDKGFRC